MYNLLKEILERVEYERLIEEGKDPVEVLHYKFQHIPSEIIDDVIAIDPTKKKSYSQWLLSKWDDEKDTIVSAFSSILLGCFCPSPQQEVPRLRALHPQVPVQRQTSQEKANAYNTGTTATIEAIEASKTNKTRG